MGGFGWVRRAGVVVAGLVFSLAGGAAHGQATTENPLHTATRQELDIIKVVLAQEKAWNKGDLAGYASGYKDSPETLFIGARSRAGTRRLWRSTSTTTQR